jgi:hypothetical protein
MWPKGSPTAGMNFSGAGWVLWAVAIICMVFTLWLLIDAWRVRRRIQRILGEDDGNRVGSSGSDGNNRRELKPRSYIEMTCRHCQREILVPKQRRFQEVDCPVCGEPNPPARKDRLALIKALLRWLLYPSFQRRD